jgi:hypothetical protein
VTKGKKLLIMLGCLVGGLALACTLLLAFQPREPQYKGRTLSEWTQAYSVYGVPTPQADAADEAIRSIGTNALPHLLRWIRYELPPWRRSLAKITPTRLLPWVLQTTPNARANLAVLAFKALGPAASSAVPELIRIAQSQPSGEHRERARMALMYTRCPEADAFLIRTTRIAPALPTNSTPQ